MGAYDIDSLFVIKKEKAKKDYDIATLLAKYGIAESDSRVSVKAGEYPALDADEAVGLPARLASYISKLGRDISRYRKDGQEGINEIEEDIKTLHEFFELLTKNTIVGMISKNLRDPKNATDLLTPISFDRVSKGRGDYLNEFRDDLDDRMIRDLIKAELLSKEQSKDSLFMEDLKNKGIDLLRKEEMSPLAQKLFNRYSTSKAPSVIEMLANLELRKQNPNHEDKVMTSSEAEKIVQPKGAMNDYLTQAQIHYNTYSGVNLTGISANTIKTLAYVFSATQPTSVRKKGKTHSFLVDGKFSNPALREFLKENGYNSLNDALFDDWQVASRAEPKIKDKHNFRMNSVLFDSFSRYEKNFDGTNASAFEFGETLINIFETGDTITNLAIDNVKEQKLFVLGITGSNANAFMAAISLGVPLNSISLLFKSPAVAEASAAKTFNAEDAATKSFKQLEAMGADKLLELVRDNYPNALKKVKDQIATQGMREALKSLFISTDLLEKSYLGTNSNELQTLIDYVSFNQIASLQAIGQELYDSASLLSLLRGLPSDKETLDSIIDSANRKIEIESEVGKKGGVSPKSAIKEALIEEKKEAIKASEEYLQADDETKAEMLSTVDTYNSLLDPEVDRLYTANLVTRMIANTVSRRFNPSSDSIFQDFTMFDLPHVFEAYKAAHKLQSVIENSFIAHSRVVKRFCSELLDSLGIMNDKREKTARVQKEFMKFLTSDLKIVTALGVVDTYVDPKKSSTITTSKGVSVLYGKDAWAQEFAAKIIELRANLKGELQDNEFLKNIEVSTDYAGLNQIRITADKSSNPEVVALIRSDFKKLMVSDYPEVREIALDMFKYALISQGLYYSPTGLSTAFPVFFTEAYSTALEEKLATFFPKYDNGTPKSGVIQANLARIKPLFTYQLLRNLPDMVPSLKNPITYGGYTDNEGEYRRIYSGIVEGLGYDISYHGSNNPEYISNYNKDIFVKIRTTENMTYYRRLSSKALLDYYSYPSDLNETIDLDGFKEAEGTFMSLSKYSNDVVSFPFNYEVVKEGDTVNLIDYSSTIPTRYITGVVSKSIKTSEGYDFKLSNTKSVTLSKKIDPTQLRIESLVYREVNYGDVQTSAVAAVDLVSTIAYDERYDVKIEDEGVRKIAKAKGLIPEKIYYIGRLSNEPVFMYVRNESNEVNLVPMKYATVLDRNSYTNEEFDEAMLNNELLKNDTENC